MPCICICICICIRVLTVRPHWLELWDASFASFNPQLFQVCNLPMIAITRRFFNRPRVYLRFCGQNKRSSRVCLQKIDGSLGRAQSLSAESTETYGPVSTLGQMSRFNLAPNTPLAEEPILLLKNQSYQQFLPHLHFNWPSQCSGSLAPERHN